MPADEPLVGRNFNVNNSVERNIAVVFCVLARNHKMRIVEKKLYGL